MSATGNEVVLFAGGSVPDDRAALMELVDAEVMPDTLSGLVAEMFFDHEGRLSKPPVTDLGPLPSGGQVGLRELMDELAIAQELEDAASADRTRRGYGWHARHFVAWCDERGVPALPAHPTLVRRHLTSYAVACDEHGQPLRTPDGALVPAVSPGTVALRLAAINKLHEYAGLAKPGDARAVKKLMEGIQRRFLVRARNAKAALDMDGLRRVLAVVEGDTLPTARRRTALLLRARTGASAGQLARLGWADIALTDDIAAIDLPPLRDGGQSTRHELARHADPVLCPVQALWRLRAITPRLDRVFVNASAKPLTRQALHLALDQMAAEHGGWDSLPRLDDATLRVLLHGSGVAMHPKALRDRALLTTGWFLALRRSNLEGLDWGHLKDHGDRGVEVLLTRSKTDQKGAGTTLWLPKVERPNVPCPVKALRAWKDWLTVQAGTPPRPTDPVFCPIDRHGNARTTTRLPASDMNELVKSLVVKAGLAKPAKGERNPYGAHSLRSGFVTEALRNDKLSVVEVQEVTRHKSLNVLLGYRREVNQAEHNPASKLSSLL